MADEKAAQDKLPPDHDDARRRKSRWEELDELDRNRTPKKRAGFVDVMTGGDDEHPLHGVPTG